ncbi:MAG: hypothetical protein CL947_00675 [Epsilonproteobacteria bacterium]|nr:hypothetical protein [Campylobacterota bacterium]|tara:strand:+ start:2204 stop:3049 length:846 start_codon:yes stop_codon:yes gene_type:complete
MKNAFKEEKYFFLMSPALVWQLCFFFLSLILVVQLAFFEQPFQNFTYEYLEQVLRVSHFLVIFRSVKLATVTAFLCLLFGYPVASYLALYVDRRYKSMLLFLITLPFLTNLLVQIYAWYFILEKNGALNKIITLFVPEVGNWLNGSFAMYLVTFHIYLPFMVMPLYTILEKINPRLIEASLDLGGSYKQTFFRVVLPLSIQGIKTGFFLVYVTTFGEYVIPSLLGGQKHFFVGTLISEYFFIGRDWHVGAAFTCLSSCVFIISIIFFNYILQKIILRLQRI